MKQIHGIWLPDSDTHFKRMMSKEPLRNYNGTVVGCYQHFKIEKALSLTPKRGVALDVGAHVGFWSMWLAKDFAEVHAFEPVQDHADCFARNVTSSNVTLHRNAVGAREGMAGVDQDRENSGKTALTAGRSVRVHSIDSYGFQNVSLIKIDVEGYESQVLLGAVDTIVRCQPTIVFEDNGQSERYGFENPRIVAERIGLRMVCQMGKDWVYQC